MHTVLDRLHLCTLGEAGDPLFLKLHGIQAILHFGDGGLFPDDVKLYHQPTPGSEIDAEQMLDGVEFLRESLRAGRRVLVVGRTGATIVAAYLVEMGFSTAQALQMLTAPGTPRPDIDMLDDHQRELQRRSTASWQHH